ESLQPARDSAAISFVYRECAAGQVGRRLGGAGARGGHHSSGGDNSMIVLVAKYIVKPGQGDAVEAALHRIAPLVKAHEPGCTLYHANRAADNPDLFLLYEHYADQAALAAHRETPHFKEIIEGTIVPLLERRERELYQLVVS